LPFDWLFCFDQLAKHNAALLKQALSAHGGFSANLSMRNGQDRSSARAAEAVRAGTPSTSAMPGGKRSSALSP